MGNEIGSDEEDGTREQVQEVEKSVYDIKVSKRRRTSDGSKPSKRPSKPSKSQDESDSDFDENKRPTDPREGKILTSLYVYIYTWVFASIFCFLSNILIAAAWDLDRTIAAATKRPKSKRKLKGDDLEALADEEVVYLREKMREAYAKDLELNEEHRPAVCKLRMLPQVVAMLQKRMLYDSILENNVLEVVRLWLEPMPDKSLPAYKIQRELFDALSKLPIHTTHLRESGVGRIVNFYTKSTKPDQSIIRKATELIRMFYYYHYYLLLLLLCMTN